MFSFNDELIQILEFLNKYLNFKDHIFKLLRCFVLL